MIQLKGRVGRWGGGGSGSEVVTSVWSQLFEEKDELVTAASDRSSAEERVPSRPVDEDYTL